MKQIKNIEGYDSKKIRESHITEANKALISEIKNIDINSLSPIEALKKIDELKTKYKL